MTAISIKQAQGYLEWTEDVFRKVEIYLKKKDGQEKLL